MACKKRGDVNCFWKARLMNNVESRLDALEMRLTYQDETIETLNATITAQWAQIDTLTRQFANLRERLQEAEARVATSPTNEPPPHY